MGVIHGLHIGFCRKVYCSIPLTAQSEIINFPLLGGVFSAFSIAEKAILRITGRILSQFLAPLLDYSCVITLNKRQPPLVFLLSSLFPAYCGKKNINQLVGARGYYSW